MRRLLAGALASQPRLEQDVFGYDHDRASIRLHIIKIVGLFVGLPPARQKHRIKSIAYRNIGGEGE